MTNKLNRWHYSKPTDEVAARIMVAGFSTVVVSGCFGGAPIGDDEYLAICWLQTNRGAGGTREEACRWLGLLIVAAGRCLEMSPT